MTSSSEKRLENFRKHYKSVILLPSLLQDLKLPSDQWNQKLSFFQRILIVSRNGLQVERIKIDASTTGSEFLANLRKYLTDFYKDSSLANNSIRNEYSYAYFKNPPISMFLRQLSNESLRYLIFNCSFFELASDSCCIQRAGLYYSDFIWNKKCSGDDSVYLPPPKKRKLGVLDSQRPPPLSYANEACCSGSFWVRESPAVSRARMLYNRGNRRPFNEYLNITQEHLFTKIFGMLDQDLQKNLFVGEIKEILTSIIHQHNRCKFDNLAKVTRSFAKKASNKNDLLDLAVPLNLIVKFAYQVLYFVFPLKVFSTRGNFRKIFDRFKLLITAGLKVKFKVSDLRGDGVTLLKCRWLKSLPCRHRKLVVFDTFLEWLADYFIRLLRSQFYITESSSYSLNFFPLPIWSSIIDRHLNQMIKNGDLKPIMPEEVRKQLQLHPLLKSSNVRFIPRKNKLRMINGLRMEGRRFEMQSALRTLAHFLVRMEKASSSGRPKNNISSLHDAMELAKEKKLFFIRTDIQDCYPSFHQETLYELILKNMQAASFTKNECVKVRELDLVHSGRIVEKRYSIKEGLQDLINAFNKAFPSEVFGVLVPKKMSTMTVRSIELLFRNYIHLPFIRVGPKRWYQLCKGIRQGGSLSSALCSLYINDILEKVIGDFGLQEKEERLILEDDMVFITTSMSRAKEALTSMIENFPSYGLRINLSKLQFNFEYTEQPLRSQEHFTFLGRIICFRNCSIIIDYSKYNDQRIQYSFCCDPFIPMKKTIKNIINQLNLSIVLWDLNCNINSENTVALNIYERSLLQSARFACYLLLSPFYRSRQSPNSLRQFSRNLSKKIFGIAEKWSKEETFTFTLSKFEVEWIVNYSLHKIWCLKSLGYRKKEQKQLLRITEVTSRRVSKQRKKIFSKFFLSDSNLRIDCNSLK